MSNNNNNKWYYPLLDSKWLIAQAWAVGSWLPFMFSAMIGLHVGVTPAITAFGMAATWALSSILFNAIAKHGRNAGLLTSCLAVLGVVLGFMPGLTGWIGLLLACAALGAFRDFEIMGVMLRLAVRCSRTRQNANKAARTEFTISVWMRTICMAGLGWLSAIWPNTPILLLTLVMLILLPGTMLKLPKTVVTESRTPANRAMVKSRTHAAAMMFAASMVWSVLVSPMLVAGSVANIFGGNQIGWFGTICAIISLSGLTISHIVKINPDDKLSAELCILGWLVAILGVVEGGYAGLFAMVTGAAIAETFGRFWTRENNNHMRIAAGGDSRAFYRKHRRVVRRGIHKKGMTTSAGMIMAGMLLPIGPIVLPLFMTGCAAWAWRGVRAIERDTNNNNKDYL